MDRYKKTKILGPMVFLLVIFIELMNENVFPPHENADEDGLLAMGGQVTTEWLIEAYFYGVFPWFNEGDPVLWWSPNPRAIVVPSEMKVSKSLKKVIRDEQFTLKIDTSFDEVMQHCATVKRRDEAGTWLSSDMMAGYRGLHEMGLAHSFESWREGKLVGGLYGVSLGKCFFGESMFALESNASKVAFYHLCQFANKKDFVFIDCQIQNDHLITLGSKEIDRADFLSQLQNGISFDTLNYDWSHFAKRE